MPIYWVQQRLLFYLLFSPIIIPTERIPLLNESTGKYTTVAVAGLQESVKKITKMLGFEPVGKEWNEYSTEN
jgi:hypothetical protein